MTPRRTPAAVLLSAAIVVGALLQGLTATPGLGRMPAAAFAAMVAASVVIAVAQLAAVTWAVHALVDTGAQRPWRPVIAWAAGAIVVGAAATILFPPAGALVALVVVFVLPAAATGERDALRGLRVLRHAPGRSVLVIVGGLVAIGVSIVVSIATGLFLTGSIGGVTAWLWYGIATAALLAWSTRLARIVRVRTRHATHTALSGSRDQNGADVGSPQ